MKTKKRIQYLVKYLGCEGYGATRTEAKQNAMKRIERVFDTAQQPIIIRWRAETAVLWRNLDCWEYTLIRTTSPVDQEGWIRHGLSILGDVSLQNAVDAVAHHLAQNGWKPEDGKTIPFVMKGCSEKVQNDFLYWARWQLAAHHAKHVLGLTDSVKVHRWACEHEGEF